MQRKIFQREMMSGETMDHSAKAIYLGHVMEMCAALARANTKESADRKFAMKTLFRVCGRASEVGYITLDGLQYDTFFKCAFAECQQSKSAKLKFIPFIAGCTRHSDWLIDWADALIMDRGRTVYSLGEPAWLAPAVQGATSGSKITGFVKGLQPTGRQGATDKYKDFAVSSLPTDPSAAGFRHGACEMLSVAMSLTLSRMIQCPCLCLPPHPPRSRICSGRRRRPPSTRSAASRPRIFTWTAWSTGAPSRRASPHSRGQSQIWLSSGSAAWRRRRSVCSSSCGLRSATRLLAPKSV